MPSFTFVSTANAFVLRGAVPVFIDIRKDTLCIDETLIEAAITQRTKAICVVHYAGVAAEMDEINAIAKRHGIPVIEDAAQGSMSTYKGRALGSLGTFGALSYHETKNLISGEGGALLVNDARYASRAEIIWEKGTNRSSFFRGEVDKYTWVDVGSSFLPSELTAAFLWGQFERGAEITERRLHLWDLYAQALAPLEKDQLLRCPTIPAHCKHNAHMFYILLRTHEEQNAVIESLKEAGIESVFHYVPLHSSPAGRKFGRTGSPMDVTDSISQRLVRLPIWVGMSETAVSESAAIIRETLVDRSK